MRDSVTIFNEIEQKIHEVLYRGYDRSELTVLVPTREYDELLLIRDTFTIKNVVIAKGSEVVTLIGVTLQPVKGIDKIYVCL